MKRFLVLALGVTILAACRDASVAGPPRATRVQPAPTGQLSAPSARTITVMTRNLYIGADVDAVIGALASLDPNDDAPALVAAVTTLLGTSFPTRAAALADEIAHARPHVAGLQEVDSLHIGLTGLPVINLRFLPTLMTALADRGLPYAVAGQVTNITTTPVPGISLSDQDVILVDTNRVTVNAIVAARTFTFNIGVVAPDVDLRRGFVTIDATIEGMAVRIASTHLESGSGTRLSDLRAAQAAELAGVVGATSPAILLGDFNDIPGSPMHDTVTVKGFTDAWAALRPGVRGFTCCELADLSNQVAALSERIDYVFVRGLAGPRVNLLGQVDLVGDQPGDRVAGPSHPIWPSDHAGLVLSVLLPPEVARN